MSKETTPITQAATKPCERCGKEKRAETDFPHAKSTVCYVCNAEIQNEKRQEQLRERRIARLEKQERKNIERDLAHKRASSKRRRAKIKAEKQGKIRRATNAAERELAARELARRRLLAYVLRMQPGYMAGWVHRDICARLERFSDAVARQESPRLMLFMPPRHGKLCAHDVAVCTPQGWRRHGDLRVGDEVFHPSGVPVKILALSAEAEATVEVEFSNGEVVKCHPNHEWTVFDRSRGEWRTVETRYFLEATKFGKPRQVMSGGRCMYQLPEVGALQFAETTLPMHPYALGAWLGDGSSTKAAITHAPEETGVIEAVTACGYEPSNVCTHKHTGVKTTYFGFTGMTAELRTMEVWGNKHIPEVYKRGSVEQRLELLGGLIDTDGHVEAGTGRVRIATVSKQLADDIVDVARTLGFRPYIHEQQPTTSTSGIQGRQVCYYVGFQPTVEIPTRLERKRVMRLAKQRRVGIVSVREAAPELGRCIQVDSPDGLYLVGKQLVPTHNSLLASQHFPAWHLGRHPTHEIIQSSYSGSLAMGFSRKVRAALRDPDYHSVFPQTVLDRDNQNAEGWMTSKGGGYVPAGVGGAITGKGAHILGIDDPIKNAEEAESATVRDSIWEWYTSTAYTRLAPGGGVLVIQTRWNYDDLSGRLLEMMDSGEGDQFEVIEYPAIAEEDELYRNKGEALHPERYDLDALLRIQKAVGPRVWTALYQQKPTPDEGDYFQKGDFQFYRERPNLKQLVCYAAGDMAIGQKETNDYTVLIFGGVDEDDNLYILDMYRGRWDSFDITEQIIDGHSAYKPAMFGLEKGQITMAMGPYLEKRIAERRAYDIAIEDLPTGRRDKQARARAIQGRMRQKKVFFPHPDIAPWMNTLIQELLQFPNGKHDDIVDALAWLGLMLQEMVTYQPPKEKAKKRSWGDRLKEVLNPGRDARGSMAA